MPKPPPSMQRQYPPLRGHDPTAKCSGLIHPGHTYCTCMATLRTSDGDGVIFSVGWDAAYEAGGNILSVHPLPPRRIKMRSRSRDRLLQLAIVAVIIVVIALFTLPWVYLTAVATVDDAGAFAIWTAGIEVFIVGAAAVVAIIVIVSDN